MQRAELMFRQKATVGQKAVAVLESPEAVARLVTLAFVGLLAFLAVSYAVTTFIRIPAYKAEIVEQLNVQDEASREVADKILDCSFEKAHLKVTSVSSRESLLRAEKAARPSCIDAMAKVYRALGVETKDGQIKQALFNILLQARV
ncbi:hypothetical protein F6X40_11165 [Paraburkholderia sp. UCT31]|uniref:hypothetical protein n=1 Tax=Paraburkholderia sp. UCT31 TaxID=2615209 RepID=UPI001655DE2C|nr:hypothetical protein [Paraburkholderia sp. UCT31]MBC8737363.1 hypothetical protein [Paraburkholderia sp. UCT31]